MSHKVFNSDSESDSELRDDDVKETGTERLLAESESDSEDDAPDDIGFGDSKKSVLQKVQDALTQIKEDKEKVKLKRKAREENYKQQKMKKLEELQSKKLPAEILESLSSKSLKEKKKEELKKEMKEAEEKSDSEERLEASGEEDLEEDEESFIPLDSNAGIEVITLNESSKKKLSSSEMAKEFRNQRLYGKGVNRKPVSSSLLAMKKKRAAHLS